MPLDPYYLNLFAPLFRGRKQLLAISSVVDCMGWAATLKELGSSGVLILAPNGGGKLPEGIDGVEWYLLDQRADDALGSFRGFGRMLVNLPERAKVAIDRFDPDRTATAIVNTQFGLREIAERKTLSFRPASWNAIEDKTKVDAIWKRLGLPHMPFAVVPLIENELRDASTQLASAGGTVWSGDSRDGFNAAAAYVRVVSNEQQYHFAKRFFAERCDSVRITPYVNGVACSIHGIVFPDRVAVGRPIEQLIFLDPISGTFRFAGLSTVWKAPATAARDMQHRVRAVGDYLRETVNYAGAFSIDGILGVEGFLPTEINPRYSAGSILLGLGMPEIPLGLIDQGLRAGLDFDFDSARIAKHFGDESAGRVAGWTLSTKLSAEPEMISLDLCDGEMVRSSAENSAITVALSPADVGTMIRISVAPALTGKGQLMAPTVCAVLRWLNAHYAMALGELTLPYSENFGAASAPSSVSLVQVGA